MNPGVCALGLCERGEKGGNIYVKKGLKTEISNSVKKTTFRFKTCLPPSSSDTEMCFVFCPKSSNFNILNE